MVRQAYVPLGAILTQKAVTGPEDNAPQEGGFPRAGIDYQDHARLLESPLQWDFGIRQARRINFPYPSAPFFLWQHGDERCIQLIDGELVGRAIADALVLNLDLLRTIPEV